MVIHGPGSDGWSVLSDPEDVRAGSTPAEVSAAGSGTGSGSGSGSGSDDQRELQPLRGRPRSVDGDWREDLEGGGVGGMGYSEEEAAELAQRRQRSFIACPAKCRGATPVAILCLLLVVGAYSLEQGDVGVSGAIKHAVGFTLRAHAHAKHHGAVLVARLTGKRHCRPKPDSLLARNKRPQVHVGGTNETAAMAEPRDDRQQVLVPARRDGLLTIMTPVFPDNATLALLHNQLRSANKYVNMDTVHEWLFIAPREHMPALVAFLEGALQMLPCLPARKMRVVEDEACAPELQQDQLAAIALRTSTSGQFHRFMSGWVKQQLVKLACSFTVTTPWFLILDADTFFLSPLEALDLMQQKECTPDSVVCDLKRKVQFRARNEMHQTLRDSEQVAWISQSAHTLHMPIARELYARSMGVTPQILSTAVITSMAFYLNNNVTGEGESWREYLLHTAFQALQNRSETGSNEFGWTEYDLYWEYARTQGLWVKYHTHSRLQKSEANLWSRADLEEWSPCDFTGNIHTGYWAVVQSTLKLSGAEIWERLMPCLDPHSSADAAAHHTASLSGSAAPDAVDHATAAEGSDGEGARR